MEDKNQERPEICNKVKGKVFSVHSTKEGRDSSVGTATRYGLDGPEIEFRWRRDFSYPSRQAMWSTQLPIQRVLSGRGVDHPHPSNAEVKEVEVYPYFPFGF